MVAFGWKLFHARNPGWEEAYVDYAALKTQIKVIQHQETENLVLGADRENAIFSEQLSGDLTACSQFWVEHCELYENKLDEIIKRVAAVRSAKGKAAAEAAEPSAEPSAAPSPFHGIYESEQRQTALLKEFTLLRASLERLHDFQHLNKEAVRKIVKKHSKQTSFAGTIDTAELLKQQAFLQEKGEQANHPAKLLERGIEVEQSLLEIHGNAKIIEMWMWLRLTDAERRVQSIGSMQQQEKKQRESDHLALNPELTARLLENGPAETRSTGAKVLAVFNTVGAALGYILSIVLLAVFTVKPEQLQVLTLLGIIGAFWLAAANGANDTANSMGTSVGSGALSMLSALVLGSIFEFAGAMTMGALVSKTISKGVIEPEEYVEEPKLFAVCMVCVLFAAAATTFLATCKGYPISATHSIIGGLVSVGMAAKGTASIGWGTLALAAAGWVLSPVCGMLMSGATYVLIRCVVLERPDAEQRSRRWQPFFLAVAVMIAALFILLKGPKQLRIEPAPLAVVVGVGIGAGTALATILVKWAWAKTRKQPASELALSRLHVDTLADGIDGRFDDASIDAAISVSSAGSRASVDGSPHSQKTTSHEAEDGASLPLARLLPPGASATPGEFTPIYKRKAVDLEHNAEEEDEEDEGEDDATPEAELPFVPLLVVSALSVAFAHGGNDVANAVGPLAVVVEVYNSVGDGSGSGSAASGVTGTPEIHYWELSLGSAGFVVGIMLLGSRTINTVGTGLCRDLTPAKAFAVQTGAAIAVLGSSALSLPVSTSHCLVGAVLGVALASKLRGSKSDLDFSVLKKIVIGWVVTIPLAMLVAVAVFIPLKALFESDDNVDEILA